MFATIALFYKGSCYIIHFADLDSKVQVFTKIALFYKGFRFIINFADPEVQVFAKSNVEFGIDID